MIKKGSKLILRPPRCSYDPNKIPTINIIEGFGDIERLSIAFLNKRNETIFGSFYRSPNSNPTKNNVCAIYLHGNASNQLEGRFLVSLFAPVGVSVFCFDFAGCGRSTGKFVSLGHYEKDDVDDVIEVLKRDLGMDDFVLWGRSMGASVSIMAAEKHFNNIKAICLDSAYTSLRRLINDLGISRNLPKWMIRKSIKKVRKHIKKTAKFDIFDVRPIKSISKLRIPVFIIHGEDDMFVSPKNSEILFNHCLSEKKELRLIKGEHNGDRPPDVMMEATVFLCKALDINIEFPSDDEDENNDNNIENEDEAEVVVVNEHRSKASIGAQSSFQHFRTLDEMLNS